MSTSAELRSVLRLALLAGLSLTTLTVARPTQARPLSALSSEREIPRPRIPSTDITIEAVGIGRKHNETMVESVGALVQARDHHRRSGCRSDPEHPGLESILTPEQLAQVVALMS